MDTSSQKKSMPVTSTRVTATVSVAMTLFLLGLAALAGVAARNVVTDIRQRMGFVVVMDEDSSPAEIDMMKQRLQTADYVASWTYSTPDEVKARWAETLGDEEDIQSLLGDSNPFAPEFEVCVKERFATGNEIARLSLPLESAPGVDSITARTSMADKINSMAGRVALVLGIVAGALLIIAIVLINNTIRLTIYSRRFLIHTMKLVGASGAFIRRPLLWQSVASGLVAALIAIALLAVLGVYAAEALPTLGRFLHWEEAACVAAGMTVAGVLVCLLTALAATNKYLRKSFDEMF